MFRARRATELATGGTTYGPSVDSRRQRPGRIHARVANPRHRERQCWEPVHGGHGRQRRATGLVITETDSYVIGQESYRTDVTVHNGNVGGTVPFVLYRGGDCFLQNSDDGFGDLDLGTGQVGCRGSDDNGLTPNSRVERWIPLTAGSSAIEAFFGTVWGAMESGSSLPQHLYLLRLRGQRRRSELERIAGRRCVGDVRPPHGVLPNGRGVSGNRQDGPARHGARPAASTPTPSP